MSSIARATVSPAPASALPIKEPRPDATCSGSGFASAAASTVAAAPPRPCSDTLSAATPSAAARWRRCSSLSRRSRSAASRRSASATSASTYLRASAHSRRCERRCAVPRLASTAVRVSSSLERDFSVAALSVLSIASISGASHASTSASYAACRPRVFLNSSRVMTGCSGPDRLPVMSMYPTTCGWLHSVQRLALCRANDGVAPQAAIRRPDTKKRAGRPSAPPTETQTSAPPSLTAGSGRSPAGRVRGAPAGKTQRLMCATCPAPSGSCFLTLAPGLREA
mmetsp:Transcript_20936/g.69167  ORF Transcript_20936/g.69167 Transcript_20936/m.69167 type:complete len:282 (+) Transcript_20936:509-1354(+)